MSDLGAVPDHHTPLVSREDVLRSDRQLRTAERNFRIANIFGLGMCLLATVMSVGAGNWTNVTLNAAALLLIAYAPVVQGQQAVAHRLKMRRLENDAAMGDAAVAAMQRARMEITVTEGGGGRSH